MIRINSYFLTFLLGILIGFFLFYGVEDIFLSFLLLLFGASIALNFIFYYRQFRYVLLLMIIGILLSLIYSSIHQSHIDSNLDILERYEGQYVNYAGVVREVYRRDDYQDEYIVDIQLVAKNTLKNKSKSIYSIVKVPKNFQLQPGQDIEFSGRFQMIEDFDSFAYKNFLLSKSIYFRTSVSKVDIISESTSITQKIFIFRERLISVIGELYPKNEAIFLAGILFGARENIPSDLKTDFNNSGLTHFIAVSGFNITLCIIFVSFLFAYFPIWFRVIGVISTILTFSFFVGLGAPVVRASIMGILGYIFIQSGSPVRNIVLLTFTAVCMALWSPLALVYDVSLHLSFLAVIGIIYTQELFQKIFSFLPSSFAIREAFVLTLSALSFSLPIMLFQFGQVSLLAPLANIAVTWTIPLAMLGGAMSVVLYFIFPPLAELTGFITWIFLRYDIMIVQFFGNKEGALFIFEIGNYKFFAESLYFILLIYFLIMYHLKIKKNEL